MIAVHHPRATVMVPIGTTMTTQFPTVLTLPPRSKIMATPSPSAPSMMFAPSHPRCTAVTTNSPIATSVMASPSHPRDINVITLSPRGTTMTTPSSPIIAQPNHSINAGKILDELTQAGNAEDLGSVMDKWKGKLSSRLMLYILNHESDWKRSLALHDWMMEIGGYRPSVYSYNIVLRNVLKARRWALGEGLVTEMSERGIFPDRITYSTLISSFGKVGEFGYALEWFHRMEQQEIVPDLITYSTLINLAGKVNDLSTAVSLFSKMKFKDIQPDRVVMNSMIHMFGKAGRYQEAHQYLKEMKSLKIVPDTVTYSSLINAYAESQRFVEARNVFNQMRSMGCAVDVITCNLMIDVCGKLGSYQEAASLFWSMDGIKIQPNVVTFNTMIRVYGEGGAFPEAFRLFHNMERRGVPPNIVTYNTVLKLHGLLNEEEKATRLLRKMERNWVEPNASSYSTLISIYGRTGKYDKAARLFQSLRARGFPMDEILYQAMIMVYEKAGFLGHARRLLHELQYPGTVSSDSAISILAKAGKLEEAAQLFETSYEAGEVKEYSVFQNMIELFYKTKRFSLLIDMFNKMKDKHYPDSDICLLILIAYGKLGLINEANVLYRRMQKMSLEVADKAHWEMFHMYGRTGEVEAAENLFWQLKAEQKVHQPSLYSHMITVYEKANRLDEASRIHEEMRTIQAVSKTTVV